MFRKHWGNAWIKFKKEMAFMAKNAKNRCPIKNVFIMATDSKWNGFFDYATGIPPWCEYSAEQVVSGGK